LDVRLGHHRRVLSEFLRPLQHRVLGFSGVHLPPIVPDLLDHEVVAALLSQKLCVGDRSVTAVICDRGNRGDHLSLHGGQTRFAAHDLPHEIGGVSHGLGIEAVKRGREDGCLAAYRRWALGLLSRALWA
jgi:hypothetical protein